MRTVREFLVGIFHRGRGDFDQPSPRESLGVPEDPRLDEVVDHYLKHRALAAILYQAGGAIYVKPTTVIRMRLKDRIVVELDPSGSGGFFVRLKERPPREFMLGTPPKEKAMSTEKQKLHEALDALLSREGHACPAASSCGCTVVHAAIDSIPDAPEPTSCSAQTNHLLPLEECPKCGREAQEHGTFDADSPEPTDAPGPLPNYGDSSLCAKCGYQWSLSHDAECGEFEREPEPPDGEDADEAYIRSLKWSKYATEDEKTLVAGNIRAFWKVVLAMSAEHQRRTEPAALPEDTTLGEGGKYTLKVPRADLRRPQLEALSDIECKLRALGSKMDDKIGDWQRGAVLAESLCEVLMQQAKEGESAMMVLTRIIGMASSRPAALPEDVDEVLSDLRREIQAYAEQSVSTPAAQITPSPHANLRLAMQRVETLCRRSVKSVAPLPEDVEACAETMMVDFLVAESGLDREEVRSQLGVLIGDSAAREGWRVVARRILADKKAMQDQIDQETARADCFEDRIEQLEAARTPLPEDVEAMERKVGRWIGGYHDGTVSQHDIAGYILTDLKAAVEAVSKTWKETAESIADARDEYMRSCARALEAQRKDANRADRAEQQTRVAIQCHKTAEAKWEADRATLLAAWEDIRGQIPQYANSPLTPDGLRHGIRQLAAMFDAERVLRRRESSDRSARIAAVEEMAKAAQHELELVHEWRMSKLEMESGAVYQRHLLSCEKAISAIVAAAKGKP